MNAKILILVALGLLVVLGLAIVPALPTSSDWLSGAWEGNGSGHLTMAIPQDLSEYAPDTGKLVTESDHDYTFSVTFFGNSSGQLMATIVIHESVGDLSSIVGTYQSDVSVTGHTIRCDRHDSLQLNDLGPVSETTLALTFTRSGNALVGSGSLVTSLLDATGKGVLVPSDAGELVPAGTARAFSDIRLQRSSD